MALWMRVAGTAIGAGKRCKERGDNGVGEEVPSAEGVGECGVVADLEMCGIGGNERLLAKGNLLPGRSTVGCSASITSTLLRSLCLPGQSANRAELAIQAEEKRVG